jgi:SAM-dependent methyltransferase
MFATCVPGLAPLVSKADKPKWRFADPAEIEIWISEYRRGKFVAGLRLTDVNMRQHEGREAERHGALRTTVAAAMVDLAGTAGGRLLDPCCGSGTILAEALQKGWTAEGFDIDPRAVEIARRNVPSATVETGDARKIALPDAAVAACVSNLPFGQQYDVQGDMGDWPRTVLGEKLVLFHQVAESCCSLRRFPNVSFPRNCECVTVIKSDCLAPRRRYGHLTESEPSAETGGAGDRDCCVHRIDNLFVASGGLSTSGVRASRPGEHRARTD